MNPTPVPPQSLPRVLGPWIATAIVVGTVIGSGVFKKGQNVAERVPEFGLAIVVWILGGVLALLGALALAEIAVLFPRAGGNYVFLREGYGRLFGFLWGWVEFWIIRSASIAALATMFGEALHDILKQSRDMLRDAPTPGGDIFDFWTLQLVVVGTIALLATINALGTRLGGGVHFALTVIKVGSLAGLVALPFVVLAVNPNPTHAPSPTNFGRIWPEDWSAVNWGKFGAALVGVLWAYHGWMNLGPVAEEVKRPSRNIPLALLAGVLILILLYVGVNVAYYSVIPRDQMAELKHTTVATEFCLRLLGPIGAVIASAAIMTSVLGSANGNLLVGPRLLYAMARDRLAPSVLSRLTRRAQTPAVATAVLAAWACLLVVGFGAMTRNELPRLDAGFASLDVNLPKGKSPFDVVTDFAMFGAVAFETLVIAALFNFRRRYPQATHPLPYRCPGYPVVPALYVLIMAGVLMNMFAEPDQRTEALIGLGFILTGAAVYWLVFGRRKG
jgi:APA family basic amino acid/polyamine antiporter